MRSVVLATLALWGFAGANINYEGYKVYKVLPTTEAHSLYLQSLEFSRDFDFWSSINKVGNPVVVMASPKGQKLFESYLNTSSMVHDIEIEDVEITIKAEKEYHRLKQSQKEDARISFDTFYRHSEINEYLEQLARDYPDTVTIETIGQSLENRDMKLVRISSGPRNPAKPVIFIDAGIHAREWIAPATALYLINQLVENPANSYLIDDLDWIILPSANPDGYEYSWTDDRLWRKTRSPGLICDGCDPNRNFDFHWMEIGASNWECSETYAGREPYSEVETRNLADYILSTSNVKAYLSLHSYGQYLLHPYGHDSTPPPNWRELEDIGQRMNEAIKAVSGTSYTVGSSINVLYAVSGSSKDWAMGAAGINISYTVELPGGGSYGFDIPASRIQGVVLETFEGFKVLADYIATNN